jgi:hypothetical protein
MRFLSRWYIIYPSVEAEEKDAKMCTSLAHGQRTRRISENIMILWCRLKGGPPKTVWLSHNHYSTRTTSDHVRKGDGNAAAWERVLHP